MSQTGEVPAVELKGLTKRFGSLVANDGISLKVRSGAIHAIVGENGAGKSTAMKMLYGVYTPDSGEILVRGQRKSWRTPSDAIASGIGMVHQHFMLAGPYTALENVLLGAEPARSRGLGLGCLPSAFRPVDFEGGRAKLRKLSEQYGLEVDWDAPVEKLPVGVQQRIEILKLLYRDASILVLDEPTAVLTPQETTDLFRNFRKLADQGKTILIITHKLREVKALASEVTVFRAGKVVAELPVAGATEQELADLMVGRPVTLEVAPPPKPVLGEKVLEIRNLSLRSEDPQQKRPRLENVSFSIHAGEVVGIAGVEGNGQQDLLDLLIRPQDFRGKVSGSFSLLGGEGASLDTREVRELGTGVIPADRIREGLLLERSMTENFLLGFQRDIRFDRRGLIDTKALESATAKGLEDYDVRPRDPSAIAGRLSGGNQQKLIIAREFSRRLRFLVAAQPTRGVDVGAIEFIHERILEARTSGVGVLLVSSELSEVMALSDRILVMYGGKVVAEFERGQCDEKELGLWMGGGGRPSTGIGPVAQNGAPV